MKKDYNFNIAKEEVSDSAEIKESSLKVRVPELEEVEKKQNPKEDLTDFLDLFDIFTD